ncbi:MAG TPA: alpha-glucuronidase family glycosyl hydrolase, partial [Chitinophagaceae bacterium]|nr:alpha-glucuronidase family glycosyl hydrolase [Chitinophagaceae bacterium]
MRKISLSIFILLLVILCRAEDGYRLWLRYDKIQDVQVLNIYRSLITSINFYSGGTQTRLSAAAELQNGLAGLLGKTIPMSTGTEGSISVSLDANKLSDEGFSIKTSLLRGKNQIQITASTDIGILYGIFHFLRLVQTHTDISTIQISSSPKYALRLLNHWDNLNRTVERGYAGFSIWNWHQLPQYIDQRYIDYARANASIGINGTVLTNVNANALILTPQYLEKVAALANVFRPYGIRVYLTARFSAPIEIGKLKTADPLDSEVQSWWREKVKEIYHYVPDFGGFLVKANSEGQPGPQNYKRTHADGANMLADAVAPFNGIVMWRAFVYSNEVPEDRVKQAYSEFKPLDGQFRKNVLVQVKNGPLDFQPREPFSPLFGAMDKTPLMMEFQITQEYLGQGTHLVYEAPLFKEVLATDTYKNGKGSTVSSNISGIAGVANIGNERNWTNHPFAQANWYAFGRLAWDPELSSEKIADEWIRQTFSNNEQVVTTAKKMMIASREAVVNYMT